MRSRQHPEQSLQIVAAMLAVIWLVGGCFSLVAAAMRQRWLFGVAAIAALWYGVIWCFAYREGRPLTLRESLTPWRLRHGPDA